VLPQVLPGRGSALLRGLQRHAVCCTALTPRGPKDITSGNSVVLLTPCGTAASTVKCLLQVLRGRGFALLRGLPVERWSRQQTLIAYWGIGLHW
jgi:hypothetical protein